MFVLCNKTAKRRANGLNAVKLEDIAKMLDISVSTVSRALSGNGRVGAKTRERVLQAVRESDYARLRKMAEYAAGTACLRSYILKYFGEPAPSSGCGRCSNCLGQFDAVDITREAQIILSCVYRTGQRYGTGGGQGEAGGCDGPLGIGRGRKR